MGFDTGQRDSRSPNETGAALGEERFLSHGGGYASNDQDAATTSSPITKVTCIRRTCTARRYWGGCADFCTRT